MTPSLLNAYPHRSIIMIRIFPAAWTALHIGITGLATWMLCATDALTAAAPLLFH